MRSKTATRIIRAVQRAIMRAALIMLPRRPYVVVHGFPTAEGNAVEMLRALADRYPRRVFWLVDRIEDGRSIAAASGLELDRITLVRHRSLTAMWRFATAEVVMFTHGLYGNPRSPTRKTFVNLWHGGGLKASIMTDSRGRPAIHSDFLVASSAQFGSQLARQCRLPPEGLLLTGNPRTDQFARSSSEHLRRLGVPTDRPIVVWMPTFRKNTGHGLTVGWSEFHDDGDGVNNAAEHAVDILTRAGLTVIVKPHPVDAESRNIRGATIVTNDDLLRAGVQLYELIGASDALLTDYSSVWIDFLALDRPIGFIVPDEAHYAAGRGFSTVDVLEWLPGPRLDADSDFEDFARDVTSGGNDQRERRAAVARHIGSATTPHVSAAILTSLDQRGVFRPPIGMP